MNFMFSWHVISQKKRTMKQSWTTIWFISLLIILILLSGQKNTIYVTNGCIQLNIKLSWKKEKRIVRDLTTCFHGACVSGKLIAVRCLLEFWASQHMRVWFLLGKSPEFPLGRVPQITEIGIDIPHLPCNSKPERTSHINFIPKITDCELNLEVIFFLDFLFSLKIH